MAGLTTTSGALVNDVNSKPGPQYLNPAGSGFEFVQGTNGALWTQINTVPLGTAVTMQNAAAAAGVGTVLNTSGAGTALLTVTGTFVGTVTFQAQGPDSNWYSINARSRGITPATMNTTTTTTGLFEINTRGVSAIRADITAYTSGNVTVVGVAQPMSPGADTVQLVPLTASAPKLVRTIAASSLTNTGTNHNYTRVTGVLNRAARQRTFIINSTINQNTTLSNIYMFDSTLNPAPIVGNSPNAIVLGGLNSQNWMTWSSEYGSNASSLLASHVDSFDIDFQIPAVATTGSIYIYVVELL